MSLPLSKEQRIQQAVDDVNSGRFSTIKASAAFHEVNPSIVGYRRRGRNARCNSDRKTMNLSRDDERVLSQWLTDLQLQNQAPGYAKIRAFVQAFMKEKHPGKQLGKHWITRFKNRHEQLKSGRSKHLDIKRATALDADIVNEFFDNFERLKKTYNIQDEDIYNFDETGFQMGHSQSEHVVFNKTMGVPTHLKSDTTTWVTIIECVNVCRALKPFLIFIGKCPLQNWYPQSKDTPDWLYAYSPKGWTDNDLGLQWLQQIFLPGTAEHQVMERKRRHTMLIVDGHESHDTGQFQLQAAWHNVHLLYLPAHASHVLQPLDMGPFSPLKGRYSKELSKRIIPGQATIKRPDFISIYATIRPQAITRRTIAAGWLRTGLIPLNRERILTHELVRVYERVTPDLQPPPRPTDAPDPLIRTPKTFREFNALAEDIQSTSTPRTRAKVIKLSTFGSQANSSRALLSDELRLLRSINKDQETDSRSKRIKKTENQRVFNVVDVLEGRQGRKRFATRRVDRRGSAPPG